MEDIFGTINSITGITKYSSSEVITPKRIVADMVDLLPAGIYTPEAKFLDPAVKSGRFLAEIYRRLMDSELMKQAFPNTDERKLHIRRNQLYGFATSSLAAAVTRKQLYDDPQEIGNIMYTADKVTKEMIQGAFSTMKFDVVIGNPPYNNDIYLDFVTLGHSLANKYTVMITPAKWQAKGGDKNEKFRKDIVPYMSKIVFYPDATEIFDIAEIDGISYYLICEKKHDTKTIINRSSINPNFNSVAKRRVDGVLNNAALSIINKLTGPKISINAKNNHFKLCGNSGTGIKVYSGGKLSGECTTVDIGSNHADIYKFKVISNEMLGYAFFFDKEGRILGSPDYKVLEPGVVCSSHYCVYRTFDNRAEAGSLISYLNTKLIRFITALTLTGTTTSKDEFWRFVPDPGAFDHIFTDAELYKKYGLTPEEINIIESVIKERK